MVARVLALLTMAARPCGGTYGTTSPEGLSIVLDAFPSGLGEQGQEFPVAKDGAVMDNWAAQSAEVGDAWETPVTLHNIESSRFVMRSSVERHFGAPRLEINDHEVISPRIKGGVQQGGRLKTPESQGATSNSRKEIDKDLVVVYNCLSQGTAKLLLTVPFDDGDEADARGPFSGGAAASDQESLTLTLDDGEDSDDDQADLSAAAAAGESEEEQEAQDDGESEEDQEVQEDEEQGERDTDTLPVDAPAPKAQDKANDVADATTKKQPAIKAKLGASAKKSPVAKVNVDLQKLKKVDYTVDEPPKAVEQEVQKEVGQAIKAMHVTSELEKQFMSGATATIPMQKKTAAGKLTRGGGRSSKASAAKGQRHLQLSGADVATRRRQLPEDGEGSSSVVAFAWSISCHKNPKPGFKVQLAGVPGTMRRHSFASAPAVVEVANDGAETVADGWEVASAESMEPKFPLKLHHVPASENSTRFLISLSSEQSLAQPFERPQLFVNADGREVMSPILAGTAQLGGSAAPVSTTAEEFDAESTGLEKPQTFMLFGKAITVGGQYMFLDVLYNCFQPGTATVAVSIPFPGDNFAPVSFVWKKDCGAMTTISSEIAISLVQTEEDEVGAVDLYVSGSNNHGLIVNVVKDGAVLPGWAGVVDELSYQPAGVDKAVAATPAYVVDAHTGTSIFELKKIGGENTPTRFGEPILEVLSSAAGTVDGRGSGGGGVVVSPILSGTGHKGGQIFNLHPTLTKKLPDGRTATSKATLKIKPPLIKVQYNCIKPGKVTLSLTVPFHLAAPIKWTWVKDCGGVARQYFSVSTAEKLVVRDGLPTEQWNEENMLDNSVGHSDSPTGLDVATVDSSESSITFYLGLHGGQDLVDLVGGVTRADAYQLSTGRSIDVRNAPSSMGEDGRESPLETAFLKDWGADSTAVADAVGGGGRRGGHGGRGTQGVGGGLTIPEHLKQQGYGRPLIRSSDTSICQPITGGIARKGGTLHVGDGGVQGGKGEELSVRFNCRKPGKAVLTVLIPLLLYADVRFSFIKVCQLSPVEGMMIGTQQGEDDVVSDGAPWVFFDPSPEAEGKRVVMDKATTSTDFHVWLKPLAASKKPGNQNPKRERLVNFKAPVVSASPEGVCAPRIGGAMRKGGQLSSSEAEILTVRYNCFAGGSTLITVRFESESGAHDAVAWSWRKDNGPSVEKLLALAVGENQQQKKDAEQRTNADGVVVVVGALAVLVVLFALGEILGRRRPNGGLGSPRRFKKQGQD